MTLKIFIRKTVNFMRRKYRYFRYYKIIDKNILATIQDAVKIFNAQLWYIYSYKNFLEREHAFYAYKWIIKSIDKKATILETGCGIGGMLYFLYKEGYKNLSGYDYDEKTVQAGQNVCRNIKANINIIMGDGFNPSQTLSTNKYDVIIGINWIYHVHEYSLDMFITKHIKHLNKNGYFIIDLIDSKYNNVKYNEYCTQDWNKSEAERRASEYVLRYSVDEVKSIANKYRLDVIKIIRINDTVPRNIFFMQYCGEN